MAYSSATGIYTMAAGATTASAGTKITSATWNNVHSDISTGMNSLGPGLIPLILQTKPTVVTDYYAAAVNNVNFASVSNRDIATFTIPIPSSYSGFNLVSMKVYKASSTLNPATVSLFTSSGGGGLAVISSTVITVTSSLANNPNSLQTVFPSEIVMIKSNLFLHVTTSVSVTTVGTGTVLLQFEPLI